MAKHINLNFNSNYSNCFIRSLMRNTTNSRYKKVKLRPWNIDFSKLSDQGDTLL